MAILYEGLGHDLVVDFLEEAVEEVEGGTRTVDWTPPLAEADVQIDTTRNVDIEALATKLDSHHPQELSNPELSLVLHMMSKTGGTMPSGRPEFLELFSKYYNMDSTPPVDVKRIMGGGQRISVAVGQELDEDDVNEDED